LARWLLPGITLAISCAGLTILIIRHHSPDPQRANRSAVLEERGTALPMSDAAVPSINPATTNGAGAEAGEDRVVTLVTAGNQLLERGNHAAAADKYAEAVRLDPGDEDLHYNLAIALAKLGKTAEAKQHYAEALQIFPDHADARNNLGNLLLQENRLTEAIDQFREAIQISPDNASFHNNLGTAFGRQRNVTEAMAEFREAIRLRPAYVEARVNLGNACLAAGQLEEAIAQFDEALRLQPGFAPAIQALQRARQRHPFGNAPR
jgi:Tfp pilus assembly protein PilF